MILCPIEVDGAAWVGIKELEHIFNPYTYEKNGSKIVSGFLVNQDNPKLKAPTTFNLE